MLYSLVIEDSKLIAVAYDENLFSPLLIYCSDHDKKKKANLQVKNATTTSSKFYSNYKPR